MDNISNSASTPELGPIKTNIFGERYFYNINRGSFEKISSHAFFDANFSKTLFNTNSLNIIVGTDSGLLPKYIQEKGLPKGSRYIFIEPESVLDELLKHHLIEDISPEITCISPDKWEQSSQEFKIKEYFYINGIQAFNAICTQDDHLNKYAELSWHITEELARQHWNNNMSLGSEGFTSRQLINLADNDLPAIILENAFQGKTVVILAGGPSLDETLPWVQQHRKQLVIFSVSRISRQLKQINIEPDFIFSVDPTELSFDISKEMLTFSKKPVFIYSFHTVPKLVSQWGGTKLYLGSRLPWKSNLNQKNFDSTGPTVTNTALSVAHHLGFKRVVLAGVDLCFTREGYSHAKGSDEYLAGPRFNLTSLQTETNGGFMAPTSCDLAAAIDTLGKQAEFITSKNCQIINPSPNAAKVENIDHISLEEINLNQDGIDTLAIVQNKINNHSRNIHFHKESINELNRAKYQIKSIKKLAITALKINKEMYNDQGEIEEHKDKRKLDQIEKKLKRKYRQFSLLIKKFGLRAFLKTTRPFDDEEWTAEEAQEIGSTYYEAYRDGADKILSLISDSLERIYCRQEEFKPKPDFNCLLSQWKTDHSYARALQWNKTHADTCIPKEFKADFEYLKRQFKTTITNKNTKHFAQAKSYTSFSILKHRAVILFKHQKTSELEDLLSGLKKHKDQKTAMPYFQIIKGYLAELKNDPELAMTAYNSILESNEQPLLEDALLRIATISIDTNDVNNSYLSLQCLSLINPTYLPHYAEILRLTGNIVAAINAYNNYIEQFPEDTLTQIKLATLYIENNSYDAADMMIDFILTKSPTSEAAITLKNRVNNLLKANTQL